ncbi:TIGR03084 family metal-binding protein [Jatrophihabitans sp.]|uniref:TIGR03084 family metal-binding protein n=1 Tax=Jatrophihabitans sp. TaxID=1932789 RepID=UPI0030C68C25|nr:wyosine base formation protein [Jatrophihabitans sp.]
MADLDTVLDDLLAEGAVLDGLVAELDDAGWATPTPATGWTIAHQVAHLAWTDQASVLAATDAAAFNAELTNALATMETYVDDAAEAGAAIPRAELLTAWRSGRSALAAALRAVPDGTKIPWFGPPMSATSMATARLMETWAHGQDIVDALGAERPATGRIRQVAHIGTRTRDYAYLINNRTAPAEPFRVELVAPDGELWTWGPEGAAQRVTGPALDFCLLVTQRRNRADLALVATGPDAEEWLDIAQAFAGPPGAGRPAAGALS